MGSASCYIKTSQAYLSASVEWNSSYYVTVNVTSTGTWRLKPAGTPGDTNNIFSRYGDLTNGGFQGSLNTTYVFQMYDAVEESWFQDTFTVTQDSSGGGGDSGGGDSGGGGSGGGGSSNIYTVYYYGYGGSYLTSTSITGGSSFRVQSGDSVTRPSSSDSSNYTITGDANGGTFSNGSKTDSITAKKIITTSYSFSYWREAGTGSIYYANTWYAMPNNNLFLHANFSSSSSTSYSDNSLSRLPTPSYTGSTTVTLTVTFDAKGGSVSTTSRLVKATAVKTFGGWMSSSTGTTTISSLESEGTVYAKWDVSYPDATVILPLPTRKGYIFNGWSTSISGTNLYQAGAEVSISGDTTFYAIWTEKEKPSGGVFIYDGTMWQLISG